MLHDTELLQYVYKTADMGCKGIETIINDAKNDSLKSELMSQHREYKDIRGQAQGLLQQKNEEPKGVGVMAKISAEIMSTGKMMAGGSDTKIAEMTIQGNRTGIDKTKKHLQDYSGTDQSILSLTEKLLATEQSNAENLKKFL